MNSGKILTRLMKESFRANPTLFFIMLGNALFTTAATIFNIFALKIILDAVVSKPLATSLIYAATVVGIDVGLAFLKQLFDKLMEYHRSLTDQRLREIMAKKLMNAPYSYLEDPYFLDLKERAKFATENQGATERVLMYMGRLISYVISLLFLVSLLASFDLWLLLVMGGYIALTILINLFSLRFIAKFYQDLIPLNRRYGYYIETLSNKEKAKEYRLNEKIRSLMFNKFVYFNRRTKEELKRFSKKSALFTSSLGFVNYLHMGVVYVLVALKTIRQGFTAGTFSLYVGGAIAFATNAVSLITDILQMAQILDYLRPWNELMDLPEDKQEGDIPFLGEFETLEFDHVSFAYPKTQNEILKDISFKVKKGERISIVGLNGAGKTTLIKLICRLYHPTSGKIRVNGHDIFTYQYRSYINILASVFQDFRLFAYSIEENIGGNNPDSEKALHLAHAVGLKEKLDHLPLGMKSNLSKEYDKEGIELSGGQTQKIAIARALYKNASLVILDEPTSALDPLAEADIYQHFNELVSDKTAIFISHRLSSSVFCDRVLLIQDGHTVDYDTHSNLMKKKDSLYYKMFTTQAKNYQID